MIISIEEVTGDRALKTIKAWNARSPARLEGNALFNDIYEYKVRSIFQCTNSLLFGILRRKGLLNCQYIENLT